MIKIRNNVATREPVPAFLAGLDAATLRDLTWTDPALGVSDCAWLPENDQSQPLGDYQRYGAETLTIDPSGQFVIAVRAVVPWSAEEIAAAEKANVPQVVPMLNARLTMISAGWMAAVQTYLAAIPGTDGEMAREYFRSALTMRRDHPLVLGIPAAIGKTEEEVDALFIAAGALNV